MHSEAINDDQIVPCQWQTEGLASEASSASPSWCATQAINLGLHERFQYGLALVIKFWPDILKLLIPSKTGKMELDLDRGDSLHHVFDDLGVLPWLTGTTQSILLDDLPNTTLDTLDALAASTDNRLRPASPADVPEGSQTACLLHVHLKCLGTLFRALVWVSVLQQQ